jgi:hypothetical protein
MRIYEITQPGTPHKWVTTCCFAAMEFCHAFGYMGFRLYSYKDPKYTGGEIKNIISIC